MRNERYHLIQLILQGKIGASTNDMVFRTIVNEVIWTNVIANIHRGWAPTEKEKIIPYFLFHEPPTFRNLLFSAKQTFEKTVL